MIKTIIITDIMGEETTEDILEQLSFKSDIAAENFQVLSHTNGVMDETLENQEKADLIIIDYGGMLPGCDDMVNGQIKWVCEWAENHPGKAAILLTEFTGMIYSSELEDRFGGVDNIFAFYSDKYNTHRQKANTWLSAMLEEK